MFALFWLNMAFYVFHFPNWFAHRNRSFPVFRSTSTFFFFFFSFSFFPPIEHLHSQTHTKKVCLTLTFIEAFFTAKLINQLFGTSFSLFPLLVNNLLSRLSVAVMYRLIIDISLKIRLLFVCFCLSHAHVHGYTKSANIYFQDYRLCVSFRTKLKDLHSSISVNCLFSHNVNWGSISNFFKRLNS